VYEAYKAVRSNRGAPGVDGQSLEMFEKDLAGDLYKIWNRTSSGSYFPPSVRAADSDFTPFRDEAGRHCDVKPATLPAIGVF
jgi:hypothetical protein